MNGLIHNVQLKGELNVNMIPKMEGLHLQFRFSSRNLLDYVTQVNRCCSRAFDHITLFSSADVRTVVMEM